MTPRRRRLPMQTGAQRFPKGYQTVPSWNNGGKLRFGEVSQNTMWTAATRTRTFTLTIQLSGFELRINTINPLAVGL